MITAQRANVFNPFKSQPPEQQPVCPSRANYGTFANHRVSDEILTSPSAARGGGGPSIFMSRERCDVGEIRVAILELEPVSDETGALGGEHRVLARDLDRPLPGAVEEGHQIE